MDTSDHADIAELRSTTEEFLQLSDTKAALSNLVSRLNESKRPTHFRTGGSKLDPCPTCGQLVAEDEKESHVCDPVSIAMMQSTKPEYALRQRAEAARASPQNCGTYPRVASSGSPPMSAAQWYSNTLAGTVPPTARS